jgi:hypothetical protein
MQRTPRPHKNENAATGCAFRFSASRPSRAENIQSLPLNRCNENNRARSNTPVVAVLGAADRRAVIRQHVRLSVPVGKAVQIFESDPRQEVQLQAAVQPLQKASDAQASQTDVGAPSTNQPTPEGLRTSSSADANYSLLAKSATPEYC